MVGIYLPLYDALYDRWTPSLGVAAPMAAGGLSRFAAVLCVAPFELVRTRLQASQTHSLLQTQLLLLLRPSAAGGGPGGPGGAAAAALPGAGARLRGMWTGVTATIARDVPFSIFYWSLVEPIRRALLHQPSGGGAGGSGSAAAAATSELSMSLSSSVSVSSSSGGEGGGSGGGRSGSGEGASGSGRPPPAAPHTPGQVLTANMAAGALSGASAAALTTPFDVVKTRQQVLGRGQVPHGLWAALESIYRGHGLPGLYTGVAPRAARAAPACAIVISVYELIKNALEERRR